MYVRVNAMLTIHLHPATPSYLSPSHCTPSHKLSPLLKLDFAFFSESVLKTFLHLLYVCMHICHSANKEVRG